MKKEKSNNKKLLYEVTSQGSLGMLALGAIGIIEWRKKKIEENKPIPQIKIVKSTHE